MATTSYNDQNHAKYKRHFLQGNLRTYNREKEIQCYKTYVSHVCIRIKTYVSIVKYVSAALDTKNNIEKVERVQRMAARFMIYDFNRGSIVTNMIKEFNLDFMELR